MFSEMFYIYISLFLIPMKQIIAVLLIACARFSFAQVSETFQSEQLTPTWYGCDSVFIVNATRQLQLNATAAGEAYLCTTSQTTHGEWEFWCRFQFSPSTSNLMRVYVMSDTSALNGAVHGYYVQLGGVTGNNDSIVLVRQDGLARTVILGGRKATVAKSDNIARVKLLRDEQGNWQLFSDTTGNRQYVLEGTCNDARYQQSNCMGVYAKYTVGNIKKMFWDDVYAGNIRVDTVGPHIVSVEAIASTRLRVVFDEPLDETSALNADDYELNNGIGLCVSAQWGANGQTVLLDFNKPFANQTYQLTARNKSDEIGNNISEQQFSFSYYYPLVDDIIISEWMPDPSPVIGLPEKEFVELYNRSNMDVSLKGWKLSDGTTTVLLPNDTLHTQSFAIVCAMADTAVFNPFGRTIGVSTLPSLNNAGDHITLSYLDGTVVHNCTYDLSWYGDATKSNGGYSIELNSPNQLCKGKYNAGASDDESGGTPGRANSRWTLETDTTAPEVSWFALLQSNHVRMIFNEPMDSLSLSHTQVLLNNERVSCSQTWNHDTLDILLQAGLHKDSVYVLLLKDAKDCTGNELWKTIRLQYVVPDAPQLFDVLINEVMSDPDPVMGLPNAEYVELYNRSKRLISLNGWTLSDGTSTAVLKNVLLYPDSFIVITGASKQSLFNGMNNIMGVVNFPSLGNETDTLFLRSPDGSVVHWLMYQSTWHKEILKRNGGWSLELVDANNPCGQAGNWRSSVHSSGGTPGRRNSVTGHFKDKQPPLLTRVFPVSDKELKLYFNESVDSTSVTTQRFQIHGLSSQAVQFSKDGFRSVRLLLDSVLNPRIVYTLVVDSVCDCAGNRQQKQSFEFGLPEPADSGDVVINEVLFNPTPGGSDFVELYNRSERIVDVGTLYLANRNADGELANLMSISGEGYLLFPRHYLVCSPDINWVKQNYTALNPSDLVQTKLPSMNDAAGFCILTNATKILDELAYDEKMHLSVLDKKEGVSLERIDFNRPTTDRSNWTSASSTSGYATPTARNSQYATTTPSAFIKAEPEVFSPDGDGYNDVVNLSYNCETAGNIGSFWVYNATGQLVKRLLSNAILGTEGVFTWDGVTDNGQRAPMGIYVGYFEVFTTEGKVESKKITIVVAAKL